MTRLKVHPIPMIPIKLVITIIKAPIKTGSVLEPPPRLRIKKNPEPRNVKIFIIKSNIFMSKLYQIGTKKSIVLLMYFYKIPVGVTSGNRTHDTAATERSFTIKL